MEKCCVARGFPAPGWRVPNPPVIQDHNEIPAGEGDGDGGSDNSESEDEGEAEEDEEDIANAIKSIKKRKHRGARTNRKARRRKVPKTTEKRTLRPERAEKMRLQREHAVATFGAGLHSQLRDDGQCLKKLIGIIILPYNMARNLTWQLYAIWVRLIVDMPDTEGQRRERQELSRSESAQEFFSPDSLLRDYP
jgi:hypothetical protein